MTHGGDIYTNKIDMDYSVNLNPNRPPKMLLNVLGESIKHIDVYPDLLQRKVIINIANSDGVKPQCVYAGNGASELIMSLVKMIMPKKALLIEPGFGGYRHALESIKECSICEFELKPDNAFVLDKSVLEVMKSDMDIMVLTDPWNPIGANIDNELLIEILKKARNNNTYVVLDQSFYLLSDKALYDYNIQDLIDNYENLIIVRSYTKLFGMPGIRMGYIISAEENILGIKKQLPEWNVSVVAQEVMSAGAQLLTDDSFVKESLALIEKEREYLSQELRDMGCKVYKSDTVFIFFYIDRNIQEELLKRRILIRDCSDFIGLKKGYFRIAIKDHISNIELVKNMREVICGN